MDEAVLLIFRWTAGWSFWAVFSATGPTEMQLRADLGICWNDCVFFLATATDFEKGWG